MLHANNILVHTYSISSMFNRILEIVYGLRKKGVSSEAISMIKTYDRKRQPIFIYDTSAKIIHYTSTK